MSVTTHERPGVYSVYDASSVVQASRGGKVVGLVALCQEGTADQALRLSKYEEAVSAFGSGEVLTQMAYLLFANGAAQVVAVPVESADDYADAFATLEGEHDVAIVVCDSTTVTVQQALMTSVERASQVRCERIGVVCGGEDEAVSALVDRAEDLNSERMVLVAPSLTDDTGALVAAAVAGCIAGELDPAVPLGGAELKGIADLAVQYDDNQMDTLIQGGVTPVERVSGVVSVVRGVTTRTTSGGEDDSTWHELSTILIVDEVIPALRSGLRAKFQRAKNTQQTRGAIRSQVILELENRVSREIITGYSDVKVTALEDKPTVCLVEFGFTVAHGLNQIWLSAHITV